MNTCDIIIPTYNGGEKLLQVLRALSKEHIPTSWNIRLIICDDGSSDDPGLAVGSIAWPDAWLPAIVLNLSHGGRSTARNAGIRASTSDILLFLADDIVFRSGSIAQHLYFHDQQQDPHCAALGWVLWDPCMLPTPFMEWMTHGGQQNDYDALLGKKQCLPESFFYGSHVSLKRLALQGEEFSQEFTLYGWEDLEFGKRLQQKGLILHVLSEAVGSHIHWYSAETLMHRQRIVGATAYNVNTNTFRKAIHGLYQYCGLRSIVCWYMKKYGNTVNIPYFFHIATAGEFWYGVHHANRLLKSEKE